MEKKRRKIKKKGMWKIENGKRKSHKMRDAFSFFFFFFFFCSSLLKSTEICFGSTKMGIFYREKAFDARKTNLKKWLCPSYSFPARPQWRNSYGLRVGKPAGIQAKGAPAGCPLTLMFQLKLPFQKGAPFQHFFHSSVAKFS